LGIDLGKHEYRNQMIVASALKNQSCRPGAGRGPEFSVFLDSGFRRNDGNGESSVGLERIYGIDIS
jgi:hypothetical protein